MDEELRGDLFEVLSAETGRHPGDPIELKRCALLARLFPQDEGMMIRAIARVTGERGRAITEENPNG